MGILDYLLIAAVALALAAAIAFIVKHRRGCRGCHGDCSRCNRRD